MRAKYPSMRFVENLRYQASGYKPRGVLGRRRGVRGWRADSLQRNTIYGHETSCIVSYCLIGGVAAAEGQGRLDNQSHLYSLAAAKADIPRSELEL